MSALLEQAGTPAESGGRRTDAGPGAALVRAARRRSLRRGRTITAVLAAAVVILFAVSILLGTYTVTIPDFFRILGGEIGRAHV